MAHIIGTFRLGRDAELRRTQSGDNVANLALAFNYGRRDQDGKQPSQWVEASLWGARAESLSPYLVKGQQVYCVLSEPHVETFEGRNGPGAKLVARVLEIEFVGSKPQQSSSPAPQQRPQSSQRPAGDAYRDAKSGRSQPAQPGSGFDDLDDSVPF